MTVIGKIPIFTNSRYADIIIKNFRFYREKQSLKIFYYVIMDNHIHLIVSHPENIRQIMQNLKSYTARELINTLKSDNREWIMYLLQYFKSKYKSGSKYQFWEEGSHPQIIESMKILRQKVEYIHNNPVKRGLVKKPEDWRYSSASNIAGIGNVFDIDVLEM